MRRLLPSLPILAALALIVGLIALFRVAQRFDPSRQHLHSTQMTGLGDIGVRFEDSIIISRLEGHRKWSLHAARIDLRRSTEGGLADFREAECENIHDGLLYRDGHPVVFFTAQTAAFDQTSQQCDVRQVTMRSPKGDRFESPEMLWSERDDAIQFPQGAHGLLRGHTVSAPRLLYNSKQRSVECSQGAHAVFDGLSIQASALYWDVGKERVHCPGPVSGTRTDISFVVHDLDLDLKTHTWRTNEGRLDQRIDEKSKGLEGTTVITRRLALGAQIAAGVGLWGSAEYAARPAQTKDSQKASGMVATKKSEQGPWQIQFASLEQNDAIGTGRARKVIATDPDNGTVIHCNLWKWNDKQETAQAMGNLLIEDPRADATGDKADIQYARAKRIAVLTGNVHITVKPKPADAVTPPSAPPAPAPVVVQNGKATLQPPPDSQDDRQESARDARKYPADITCDKLEYEYASDKKHAVLTGHFRAVQHLPDSTRTLTADHAEWFGLEERVLLYGPVHFEDTKGRKGDTKGNVTIFTTEGNEKIKMGAGTATYPIDSDENETPPTKPTKPPHEKR